MFMAVGVAFSVGARNYDLGTGARMGPGYFPAMLGVLMGLLGAAITVKALVVPTADGEKIGRFAWRPLAFILAANLIFGVAIGGVPSLDIPEMGLIAGIYALTFIASMAEPGWKFKNTLLLATVLAIGSYLAFIVLLKLQFPVWPAFITG